MSLRAVRGKYMMEKMYKSLQSGETGLPGFTPAPPPPRKKRRDGRRGIGVELVEFTLTFLPMVAMMLLLLDIGWAVFKRATLQFAVREGARYAVTNQVQAGMKDTSNQAYGMVDSVKYVVQSRAIGFLGSKTTDPGYSLIQVRFYDPTASMTTPLAMPTGCTDTTTAAPNWAGNLVEVSVENYQQKSMGPLLRDATPLNFVARSADRMEGNPIGGVPNTYNGTCP